MRVTVSHISWRISSGFPGSGRRLSSLCPAVHLYTGKHPSLEHPRIGTRLIIRYALATHCPMVFVVTMALLTLLCTGYSGKLKQLNKNFVYM